MDDPVVNSILLALFNMPLLLEIIKFLAIKDILRFSYILKSSDYDEKLFLRVCSSKLDKYDKFLIWRAKKLNGVFYRSKIVQDSLKNFLNPFDRYNEKCVAEMMIINSDDFSFTERQMLDLLSFYSFDTIWLCEKFFDRKDLTIDMLEIARSKGCSMKYKINHLNKKLFDCRYHYDNDTNFTYVANDSLLDFFVKHKIVNEKVLCLTEPSKIMKVLDGLNLDFVSYWGNKTKPVLNTDLMMTNINFDYLEIIDIVEELNLSIYINFFPIDIFNDFEREEFNNFVIAFTNVNIRTFFVSTRMPVVCLLNCNDFDTFTNILAHNSFTYIDRITLEDIINRSILEHSRNNQHSFRQYYNMCLISLARNKKFWHYVTIKSYDNFILDVVDPPTNVHQIIIEMVKKNIWDIANTCRTMGNTVSESIMGHIIHNPVAIKIVCRIMSEIPTVNMGSSRTLLLYTYMRHLKENNFDFYNNGFILKELTKKKMNECVLNIWNSLDYGELALFSYDESMYIAFNIIKRGNLCLPVGKHVRTAMKFINFTSFLLHHFHRIGISLYFRLILSSLLENEDGDLLCDKEKVMIFNNISLSYRFELKKKVLEELSDLALLLEKINIIIVNHKTGLYSVNWNFELFNIENVIDSSYWGHDHYNSLFIIGLFYARFDTESLAFLEVSSCLRNFRQHDETFFINFLRFQHYTWNELKIFLEPVSDNVINVKERFDHLKYKLHNVRVEQESKHIGYLEELY